MELFKIFFDTVAALVAIIMMAVLLFTVPSWLIWNHIISPKFGLPIFSFWEMFWMLVFIKLAFSKTKDIHK